METGCQHPDTDTIHVAGSGKVFAVWCSICGSLRDVHGNWRAPRAVVLPGWTCACGTFNGSGKELLDACRHCGSPRRKP